MDDDGGPSYWWRDKRIKQLQQTLGEVHIALGIQNNMLDTIGSQEPEILERFERFVGKVPAADLENADTLLDAFAKSEDQRRFRSQLVKSVLCALFPLFLSLSLGCLVEQPIGPWHIAFWVAAIISLPISLLSYKCELGDHLGERELRQLRRDLESRQKRGACSS